MRASPSNSRHRRRSRYVERPTLEIPNDDNPLRAEGGEGRVWRTRSRRIERSKKEEGRPAITKMYRYTRKYRKIDRSQEHTNAPVTWCTRIVLLYGQDEPEAPRKYTRICIHIFVPIERAWPSGPTIICICAYTQCERILIPTAKFLPLFVPRPRLSLLSFFHSSLLFLLFFSSSLFFIVRSERRVLSFLTWSSSYEHYSLFFLFFFSSSFVFVSTHPLSLSLSSLDIG